MTTYLAIDLSPQTVRYNNGLVGGQQMTNEIARNVSQVDIKPHHPVDIFTGDQTECGRQQPVARKCEVTSTLQLPGQVVTCAIGLV